MPPDAPPPLPEPRAVAEAVARGFFGVDPTIISWERAAAQYLLGALEAAILVPQVFQAAFDEVGPLGWGTTVFVVTWFVLATIGLFFIPRTRYHTTVRLRGDWLDRVGAFWLASCVFGPLLGWAATSALPLTAGSWRWVFGLRVFLAAGLPLLTALSLTR